jgi:hypothetical protein
MERVEVSIQRDNARTLSAKRPAPKITNRSGDVSVADYASNEAAGLTTTHQDQLAVLRDIDGPDFDRFPKEIGVEGNEDIDELIKRFTAWKIYSRIYTDPTQIKALVLKTSNASKKTPTLYCEHC